ncbi:CCRN4L [Cordylochernes scorpioides]|uniref:Nocturnin n=1 Tax=Cordylochernes scorpioides TaxID=51811 RepID=A0ABY6KV85_9ARAC|nr:CCRN4L [Cordylochernes scorpioides]
MMTASSRIFPMISFSELFSEKEGPEDRALDFKAFVNEAFRKDLAGQTYQDVAIHPDELDDVPGPYYHFINRLKILVIDLPVEQQLLEQLFCQLGKRHIAINLRRLFFCRGLMYNNVHGYRLYTVHKCVQNGSVLKYRVFVTALGTSKDNFIQCPKEALQWTVRRWRILEQIAAYCPDVVCLQEVDHFDCLRQDLGSVGYTGVFYPKPDSPCYYVSGNNGPDGCAVFVRSQNFQVLRVTSHVLQVSGGESNQVAIVATIRRLSDSQEFCIVTTHLKAKMHPSFVKMRYEQGESLLQLLQNYRSLPVIICGDFNAEPSEPVCQLMMASSLGLDSAYRFLSPRHEEPEFTTWKIRGDAVNSASFQTLTSFDRKLFKKLQDNVYIQKLRITVIKRLLMPNSVNFLHKSECATVSNAFLCQRKKQKVSFSSFLINSRRVRVWRRRGERSNPAAIVERPTVRQRGIMVWGAIAYDSRSPLLRIQGTMTAKRYVDDVLRPVTLPYLQGVPNALYQQDNARPHTARISQQALQDVQMLPWPPYSPDLSPIEHVWDIIGRRLHALPQPRSEDELWQMVEREWRAIPQDAIRTLIDSLPRRVAACIAVRGGPTCY